MMALFNRHKADQYARDVIEQTERAAKRKTVPRSLSPFLAMLFAALGPMLLEWLQKWIDDRKQPVSKS